MGPWLHYDHDEHGGYAGFSHATCNKRAGAIKGNRTQRGQRRTRAQPETWMGRGGQIPTRDIH